MNSFDPVLTSYFSTLDCFAGPRVSKPEWKLKFNEIGAALAEASDRIHARCNELEAPHLVAIDSMPKSEYPTDTHGSHGDEAGTIHGQFARGVARITGGS